MSIRNMCVCVFYYNKYTDIISTVKPIRCTSVSNLLYFGMTLEHVSDDLPVHHQEFKTVPTATGICQTDTAACLLGGTR